MQDQPASLANALEGAAYLVGSRTNQDDERPADQHEVDSLTDAARRIREVAKTPEGYAPVMHSLADVHGIEDFRSYLGEKAGAGLASVAPYIGVGALGAYLGGRAGGSAGAAIGGLAAPAAPMLTQNFGDMFSALRGEGVDGERAARVAATVAAPLTAIDLTAMGGAIGRLSGSARNEFMRNFASRVLEESARSAAVFGAAGAAHAAGVQGTLAATTGVLNAPERLREIAASALDSAIGGATVGALTGAVPDRGIPPLRVGPDANYSATPEGFDPFSVPGEGTKRLPAPAGGMAGSGPPPAAPPASPSPTPPSSPPGSGTGSRADLEHFLTTGEDLVVEQAKRRGVEMDGLARQLGLGGIGRPIVATYPDGERIQGTLIQVAQEAGDAAAGNVPMTIARIREEDGSESEVVIGGDGGASISSGPSGMSRFGGHPASFTPAPAPPAPAPTQAPSDFAGAVISSESGGNPMAKNPRSSAFGAGQFIDSTWLSLVRQHRPDWAAGRSDGDILAMRADPDRSAQMVEAYAQDNARHLGNLGLPVTPGTLRLAHFLGPSGAADVLDAAPDTPLSSLLDAAAMRANPQLQGKTAGWVIDWAEKQMSVSAPRAPRAPGAPKPAQERPQSQETAPAPQNVPAPRTQPPAPQEDLSVIGQGMAGAITSNLYDALVAKANAGKTTENGAPSTVLQVAKAVRDRTGSDLDVETMREIGRRVVEAQDKGLSPAEFSQRMREIVDDIAPPPTIATPAEAEDRPLVPQTEPAPPISGAPAARAPLSLTLPTEEALTEADRASAASLVRDEALRRGVDQRGTVADRKVDAPTFDEMERDFVRAAAETQGREADVFRAAADLAAEEAARRRSAISVPMTEAGKPRTNAAGAPPGPPDADFDRARAIASQVVAKMGGQAGISSIAVQRVLQAVRTGRYDEALHPDNRVSRETFTRLTGVKLPRSLKGTREVFRGEPFPIVQPEPSHAEEASRIQSGGQQNGEGSGHLGGAGGGGTGGGNAAGVAGGKAGEPAPEKGQVAASPARDRPTWRKIGKNASGETVYEDERGVRSVSDGRIRETESVGVGPRGVTIPSDSERDSRFRIAGESARADRNNTTVPAANSVPAAENATRPEPLAPPPPLPPDASSEQRVVDVAQQIALEISRHRGQIEIKEVQQRMEIAFGQPLSSGAFDRKDMYDAVELATNLAIRRDPSLRGPLDPKSKVERLDAIDARLPAQPVRTQEQLQFQQFSTPHPYAYAIVWAANVGDRDVVLEPSAGTGNIAVMAMNAGPREVFVNELSPRRAALISELGPTKVFTEDAEQIDNTLPAAVRPTVVVMNPPFSQTAGRVATRDIHVAGRHIQAALDRLEPGGRLVAIVGRGMRPSTPAHRDWFRKLREEYTLAANVGVSGEVYKRFGTSFDTRVLVIDKTGPQQGLSIKGDVASVAELIDKLEQVRNERVQPSRGPEEQPQPDQHRLRPAAAGGQGEQAGGSGAVPAPAGRMGDGSRNAPQNSGSVGGGRVPGASGLPVDVSTGGSPPLAVEQPAGGTDQRGAVDRGGENTGDRGPAVAGPDRGPSATVDTGVEPRSERIAVESSSDPTRQTGEITDSIYETYTPSKVRIQGAKAHPSPLVESAAMATVESPPVKYRPHLPPEVVSSGALSLPQLESVVYAGQAHETMLPVRAGETASRRGFFVGDGTGVGKGREIAGIILDNMRQGREKALWISEKRRLIEDAKRDASGIGLDPKLIFDLLDTDLEKPISGQKGVLFTSYDTLRAGLSDQQKIARGGFMRGEEVIAKHPDAGDTPAVIAGKARRVGKVEMYPVRFGDKKTGEVIDVAPSNIRRQVEREKPPTSRIDQIVHWVGPDFDGVIAFDESHNMANAISVKGDYGVQNASMKAQAGIALQQSLPNARVVYVSATGATEVYNLAYAERLGLWGYGTSFADRAAFINEVGNGGLAAMELVARDAKALGVYLARGLSYDGVEQRRLEHVLTPEQRSTYDDLATAWQVVLQNIGKALELTADSDGRVNAAARKAANSAFWVAHQQFFNQVITSMQMPTVLAAVEKDVAEGRQSVLQIVNTMAASTTRAAGKVEGGNFDDLDITPRDALINLVEKSFPTQQYEKYTDESGNPASRPVVDAQGKPVQNRKAIEMREALIDRVAAIKVPQGPLDILLDHFGVDHVAEITGRTTRYVLRQDKETGKIRRVRDLRAPAVANIAEARAFQDGKKRILIFSDAGGTGASYHSEISAPSSGRRRAHYLVQAGWRADKAIQGLGRSHRSNQATAPIVNLVTTDLAGHKRFISSIARRLAQLGALTKGQRETADQGGFSARDSLEGREAVDALSRTIRRILANDVPGMNAAKFEEQTGLKLTNKNGAQAEIDITQFLNRLLSMKIADQRTTFDAFSSELDHIIEERTRTGTLDAGLETVRAHRIRVEEERTVHTDEASGAKTQYVRMVVSNPSNPRRFGALDGGKFGAPFEFATNRNGKIRALFRTGVHDTLSDGRVAESIYVVSPNDAGYRDEFALHALLHGGGWKRVSKEDAKAIWDREVAETPEFIEKPLHFLTGAILPVWNVLHGSTRVMRAQTDDGRRFLGRVVPNSAIARTLDALGVQSEKPSFSPADVAAGIVEHGDVVSLSNGWSLKRRTVAGQPRIEVQGPQNWSEGQDLIKDGVFSERIGYQTRWFVPTGADAAKVIEAVTKFRPVVSIERDGVERKPSAGGLSEGREEGHTSSGAFPVIDLSSAYNEASNANTSSGSHNDAYEFLKKWEETNTEAAVVIGSDGKMVDVYTSNKKSYVAFSEETNKEIAKIGSNYVIHHNHPSSFQLSAGDIEALAANPGLRWIVSHGSDGSISAARMSDGAYAAFSDKKFSMKELIKKVEEAVYFSMRERVSPGASNMEIANKWFAEIVNRSLANSGIIDYVTSYPARTPGNFSNAYRSAERTIKEYLKNEGIVIPAPNPDRSAITFRTAKRLGVLLERDAGDLAKNARGSGSDQGSRGSSVGAAPGVVEGVARPYALLREEVDNFAGRPGTARALGRRIRNGMRDLLAKEEIPGNIEVVEKKAAHDLNPLKAWLYVTGAAWKPWPPLERLQRLGVSLEIRESEFATRLLGEHAKIMRDLTKPEIEQLAEVLFQAEADGRVLTRQELEAEDVPEKVASAYLGERKLLEKVGRLVDQHNRSMLSNYRARKFQLLRMASEIAGRQLADVNRMYARREKLRRKIEAGKGDPEELAAQISAIEEKWHTADTKRRARLDDITEEIDTIDRKLAETSVRRIVGYVPHRFFGSWAVYRVEGGPGGEEGEAPHLIAGKDGFWPSREAAVLGAKAYLDAHPDAQIKVRPVEFKYPNSEATALTDKSYFRLIGRLKDTLELDNKEVFDLARGVARRTFRRRIAGFSLKRKGVEGFSREIDSVIRSHISQAVRYVILDKLKYEAIDTIEKMGLSPHASSNSTTKVLADSVNAWLRDMNGQKQPIEQQIDAGLFDKPWAKPWRLGLGAGGVTGLAALGLSGNPLISGLLGSYAGFRAYRAASSFGSFPTRSLMHGMTSDMSQVSLGAFFNLYSAIRNLTQTAINTWPLLGERWTAVGIAKTVSAVRSRVLREPNRYSKLLERADIVSQWKYAEVDKNFFRRESAWRAASMFAFNSVETFNRAVAFLGAYERAKDMGATEGAAFRAGREMMLRTQHHYGNASKPALLRQTVLALPAQFKNFMAQQVAFTVGLGKQWRSNPGALARHLLALFLLAGTLGLPGLDLIDLLLSTFTGWSPIDAIKEAALRAQAGGQLSAAMARIFARGAPTIFGDDLSSGVGEGDFAPKDLGDLQGVWASKIGRAIKLGALQADWVDQVRNLSPGIGAPLKAIESFGFPGLLEGTGVVSSPLHREAADVMAEDLTRKDKLTMAFGGTPLKVTEARDRAHLVQVAKDRQKAALDGYLGRIVRAYRSNADNQQSADAAINSIIDEASRKGVVIKNEQIRGALRNAQISREQRMMRSTPRALRPEVEGILP